MKHIKGLSVVILFALLMHTGLGQAMDNANIPTQNEIMGWIDKLCEPANRRPGESGGLQGEDFIINKFNEFGLIDVRKEPVKITLWRAEKWAFSVGGEKIPCFYGLNTGFTPKKGITVDAVFLMGGTIEDFEKIDVKGKIAVIDMNFAKVPIFPLVLLKGYYLYDPDKTLSWWWSQPAIWVRKNWNVDSEDLTRNAYERASKKGALAVVWILKDQPTNINSHYGPYDGEMKDLPALYVGKKDGIRLRNILSSGPKEATIVQTGTKTAGVMHNIHGILPGKSKENIIISSHHDSPFKGYTEDAAGMSMVLSLAKYFSGIPKEKRDKTLVFLASSGHFYGSRGIMNWIEKHKGNYISDSVLNLNIEHVPVKDFIEGKDGNFADTGLMQLGAIFIDNNDNFVTVIKRALINNNLARSGIVAIDALGKDPPGEGRFTHRAGIPVIHYISGPAYLLVDADNRDKIYQEKLVPAAMTFIEIIEKLASLSREELKAKEK